MVSRKIFYTRYAHTHQLLLWLTLDLPNLCISVYIYTYTPGVAPARTPLHGAELPANPINYHAIRPELNKNALVNA